MAHRNIQAGITTAICILFLTLPGKSLAASDEDLAALRAQLQALSDRLDRLEDENRALTATNAELLKTNEENVAALIQGKEEVATDSPVIATQTETSDWTDKIRWQGDFRYRFESFDIEGKPDRNRNRVRARAALIADITPTMEVGLGLASGGDDPVSSNQTLGGGGSTKELRMDLATPISSVVNSRTTSTEVAKTPCSGTVTGDRKELVSIGIRVHFSPMVWAPGLKATATKNNLLPT